MIKPGILPSAITILFLCSTLLSAQPKSPTEEIIAAVKACDLVKVKTLSDQQPDLLLARENSATLLHLADVCHDTALAEFLIEHKADVNAIDENKRTPLSYAAMYKNLPMVKLLVAKHANINFQDSFGYTPLHLGDREIAQFLLSNGADPNAIDREGRTILHYQTEKDLIELLAHTKFNFNARDGGGRTALHLAAKGAAAFCTEKRNRGWSWSTAGLEDVRALLAAGADVNVQDSAGVTPLMEAGNYEDLVLLLLAKGANINAQDAYVGSALHQLVQPPFPTARPLRIDHHSLLPPPCSLDLDPIKKLEFFLSHGADPNLKNRDGRTVLAILANRTDGADLLPAVQLLITYHANLNARDTAGNSLLHLAAIANNAALVQFFLEHGIDANVRNAKQQTPLHLITDAGIAKLLISHKANPFLLDQGDMLPLYHAVEAGSPEFVKLLIGLRSYAASGDVFSTFHLATRRGNVEIMEALVKAGAIVNRMGNDRQTALHEAAANPTSTALENVKFLIAHGARVNARDKFNNTPLHAALEAGPTEATLETAKFLLANGANPNIKNVFGETALDLVKFHRKYMEQNLELNKRQDEVIALLESMMVVVPERRVFGQVKLADGTVVKATVSLKDAESWANLGRMETKDDGQFEFHLPEGQQFQIGATFQIQKDGKRLLYITEPGPVVTVQGDVGPLIVTLNRVVTLGPK